jgi:hypothetical protein
MIPLQDINPRRNPPVVTWLLILANILVFLYELSLPERAREVFFTPGALFLLDFLTIIFQSS